MSPRLYRVALRAAIGAALCVAILPAACGGEESPPARPIGDGGDEASLLGDGGTPPPEAAPPPGEPCGDLGGVELGAAWPVLGGCPKRANVTVSFTGPRTTDAKWTFAAPITGAGAVVGAGGALWIGTGTGGLYRVTPGCGN